MRRSKGMVQSFELAFRMQTAAPTVLDLAAGVGGDAEAVRHRRPGDRRLRPAVPAGPPLRRGRRAVRPDLHTATSGTSTSNLVSGHEKIARAVDRPIAGLLTDLKARGLLDDTLVIWGGEFGRTPYTEGRRRPRPQPRRLHHLAGRRRRQGRASPTAQTDEFGFDAVEDKVHIHDLHATILHLLGLDHEQLTYRYAGRDFRLTDVHGQVVHDILA